MKKVLVFIASILGFSGIGFSSENLVYQAGHPSLKAAYTLGAPIINKDNPMTKESVELGKHLFFDPRLSGDGNMSCASCHNPSLGWSDALPTARGDRGMLLGRASPSVFNVAFNAIQMWDGRAKTLEDQATGPMEAPVEMRTDFDKMLAWLSSNKGYRAMFAKAYPGEPIDKVTIEKAIANFERTVVSNNSRFDRWIAGEKDAMTENEIRGFKLFNGKAHCSACHSGANFTDSSFHNIGLASFGKESPDVGRHAIRPVKMAKGAFKTPTVREVERTAPYFHDGSAKTLWDVVEHYDRGGDNKDNLSPNIFPLGLTLQEKGDLVAFMRALTSPYVPVNLPDLPPN